MKLLLDADLPRSSAEVVRRLGHEAIDVRDVGLRSADDESLVEVEELVSCNSEKGWDWACELELGKMTPHIATACTGALAPAVKRKLFDASTLTLKTNGR